MCHRLQFWLSEVLLIGDGTVTHKLHSDCSACLLAVRGGQANRRQSDQAMLEGAARDQQTVPAEVVAALRIEIAVKSIRSGLTTLVALGNARDDAAVVAER